MYNKRNYFLLFLDTILFVNGMAFISINAVIPYFLNELGANTFEISLAGALVSIGSFITQPIFAQLAMNLPVKNKIFAVILTLQRFIFMVYAIIMPYLVQINFQVTIVSFLIFWGIFNMFVGSYSPFFNSILAKTIAGNQRGRLIGYSGAVGNILAFGAAILVGVILKNVSFPYNYAWVFGIGAFLLLLDAWDFIPIKELPDTAVQKKKLSYWNYIKNMPKILRQYPRVAKSVYANGFIVVSNIALNYYTLYAIRKYEIDPAQVAVFTAIGVIFNTLGNAGLGIIADRYGHRHVLQCVAIFGVLAAIIVLGVQNLYAVYVAFALSSLAVSGYNISCSMHVIQNSPGDQIPIYVSINTMITLLVSSAVTMLTGVLIDRVSFVPLFILTGLSAAGGFLQLHFIKAQLKQAESILKSELGSA